LPIKLEIWILPDCSPPSSTKYTLHCWKPRWSYITFLFIMNRLNYQLVLIPNPPLYLIP
jgi:hypothetical protein